MNAANRAGLLAIDVGTSRVKLGWFPGEVSCTSTEIKNPSPSPSPEYRGGGFKIAAPQLPEPEETFAIQHRGMPENEFAEQLAAGLEPFDELGTRVVLACVDKVVTNVMQVLRNCHRLGAPQVLELPELPIKFGLQKPARVGIDRVLAAVAVNRIRTADKPAIVISLGTASTVNLISADGTFQGGAILPGLAMSANALHTGTSSLPLITPEGLELPRDAIGKNTVEAMSVGVYWGLVGGIEKLIREQSRSLAVEPQLFLTGGDAPLVVDALTASGLAVRLVPHLVLAGIAIACEGQP